MNENDKENTCVACSSPHDENKEHAHGEKPENEDKKEKGACMACSCPCDMHKEHTHE